MNNKITKISVTNQKISGRGGITLFLRYVEQTKFYEVIDFRFSKLTIFNPKGLQLLQFIKQMLAFFIDRTEAEEYFSPQVLIKFSHSKGKGDLMHRSLKEFATKEQLPFEKFGMNMVYYYLQIISVVENFLDLRNLSFLDITQLSELRKTL